MTSALCLNMIVKNEIANLDRCLLSVADHISCWVIGDTGSSDGTPDFIMSFFAQRGIAGELHSFPFENFEQARNQCLAHAYASLLPFDYLLLADADMELVVEDPEFRSKLGAPGYLLLQRAGVSYWNTRLVRRDLGAVYHGFTHEYIDVPGGVERLDGVWFKDHASGGNRANKIERDLRLMRQAVQREPESPRHRFYLAQCCRDAGLLQEAAKAYAKRAEMGGWDEEAWYARWQEARCLQALGDDTGFVRQALAAFDRRPQRAEPLYDLARFYRERGLNPASVVFSEFALTIPPPVEDSLFVEEFVYQAGLKEEYSIAAYFSDDAARRERGHAACNWLALGRDVRAGSRDLARSNLFFYTQPASALLPSFAAHPVGFAPPDGYRAMNPSIARSGGELFLVQRAVNFTLTEDGQYQTRDGEPLRTRNFLLTLTDGLAIRCAAEILPPADFPEPVFAAVQGLEDMRLFAWGGELWCCATVRELNPEGWCEQILARIDRAAPGRCRLADWRVLRPGGLRRHEKNWMPLVEPVFAEDGGERLQFLYSCDPTRIVDAEAGTIAETTPAIAADSFRGGSQAIPFEEGRLALIHEVGLRDGRRVYSHRFVFFDLARRLRTVSRAFYFHERGVEYAAGLAWHPDGRRLLISYGVGDREAWIAAVEAAQVSDIFEDIARLPSGTPPHGPY